MADQFGVNRALLHLGAQPRRAATLCSADGSTHTESNKLYRKVKHRYRPNLSPRQRPTAKARHDQAALAASAEARGATHRARPRSPSRMLNTRTEESDTVFYSYLACCMNTSTLNMYITMSYTGLTRRNTVFVFV